MAEQGYQAWHSSQNFRDAIENFAYNHAKRPEMTEAQNLNDQIIQIIQEKLQSRSISIKPEFVGSVYENLKVKGGPVKRDDIEFDIMIVWNLTDPVMISRKSQLVYVKMIGNIHENKKGSILKVALKCLSGQGLNTQEIGLPNYVLVKHSSPTKPNSNHFDANGNLSPFLVANDFLGKLQTCINTMDILGRNNLRVILRKHGPATQMDVYKIAPDTFLYSVDIVPSLRMPDGRYYVAKELKYKAPTWHNQQFRSLTWRRSYSLDEKSKILALEHWDGNRKKLLRVFKAIRNSENDSTFRFLTSYHLKNILLRVCDAHPYNYEWSNQFLGERLIDMIRELESCLEKRNQPCYFQNNVNLFEEMPEVALENLKNRCRRMINSEILMKHLLKASY